MKHLTSLVILFVMILGSLPAARAAEPCQSWKSEMEWNADADKYLYGYKSGNTWVIEPQYDYVNEFGENGLAVVAKDGKYGIIDTAGAWVLEPAYDDISGASPDGLRYFKQNGKYGVMDASGGVVHPADIEADWMGQFVNGSCVYVVGEKYGLVGVDGRRITEPVYDEIKSWFEPTDGARPVRKGELWGILAADGTERVPIQYEDLELWTNGYARVRLDGKEGILRPDGIPLTGLVYEGVSWGEESDPYDSYDALPDPGLATVTQNGRYGAVSLATGELSYPCAYASRSALVTAICLKETDPDKLWETADRLGREAGLQVTWYPGENITRLYGSDRMLRVKDGKCALSGLDGTLYTDYVFDTVQAPGLDGLFPAAQNGRWGKLDRNGNTAVEFLYDTMDSIGVNARFVSKWGDDSPPYALFTLDGKQVTDYIYWTHSEFVNGYAMVSDGKEPWGYIDAAGTPISEKKYWSIGGKSHYNRWYSTPFGEDGLAAVRYLGSPYGYNIIDTQGHELLEKPSNERPWRAGFGLWGYVDSETYKMGFVDSTGKIVIEPKYFFMEPPIKGGSGWHYDFDENGLLTVNLDSGTEGGGLLTQTIDITGKVVEEGTSEQYSIPDLYEGLRWTSASARGHNGSEGGGWGFEDETGKLVVPRLYDAVGYFDRGYASVRTGNVGTEWGDIWAENVTITVSGAVYGMLKNPLLEDEDAHRVSDWAADEVAAATQAGYVTPRCSTYQTHTITRLQFAELAVNYLEKKTGQTVAPAPADTFTDTADETVLKACAAGIVQGVGEGRFDPNGLLTREQLAAMLWRAMTRAGMTAEVPADLNAYSDGDRVSDWARESLCALVGLEVMTGTGGNALSPKDSCTVEQAILLVYRAAK